MVYNFVSVAFRANTCFGILVQKFCDQIFNFLCHWNLVPHWVRKYDRSRFYQIGQFALIWVHERWSASNHLINQDTQSPPIYWEVMARVLNNFGCKVLCCAAKRLSLLILIQIFGFLTKPKSASLIYPTHSPPQARFLASSLYAWFCSSVSIPKQSVPKKR